MKSININFRNINLIIKRIFDVVLSIMSLVVLFPLFLLIGILIKIDSKGEIFFRQKRLGKNGNPFIIFKFRTMVKNASKKGTGYKVVKNDPRITRVGKVLRKFSLDELPQLINVLRGEMSLIGPRPALVRDLARYDERQKRRLTMKPGITGLAQINGRATIRWPERIEYDLEYIDNFSIWLDIKIFFKTLIYIFKIDNVYNE